MIVRKIQHFISELSKEHHTWQIAIREHNSSFLYEGHIEEPFLLLPNSLRYWRADPFVYEKNGKTWIFCEMYDRIKQKGVIGVGEYKGVHTHFSVCINEEYHMSYPLIYEEDNQIYMLPETEGDNCITVYKCVDFPYSWKKDKVVFKGKAVDTTPIPVGKGTSYFTTRPNSNNIFENDNLYILDNDSLKPIITEDFSVRCAGNIIKLNSGLLRPSQQSIGHYGEALHFNLIESIDPSSYHERRVMTVVPNKMKQEPDSIVSICFKGLKKGKVNSGIHTYNSSKNYEVVDVSWESQNNIIVFLRNFKLYLREKKKTLWR